MTLDYLPDNYILDHEVETRRKQERKRPGLYLQMNRETMSKASIVYIKSGCKSWQEFFEKLWDNQNAVVDVLQKED